MRGRRRASVQQHSSILRRSASGRSDPVPTRRADPRGRVAEVMSERCIAVALPLPFGAPFTYRLPAGAAAPERGARVVVPFGKRRAIGMVIGPGRRRRRRHPQGRPGRGGRRAPGRAAAPRPRALDGRLLPGAAGRVLAAGDAARRESARAGRSCASRVQRCGSGLGNGDRGGSGSNLADVPSDDPIRHALREGPLGLDPGAPAGTRSRGSPPAPAAAGSRRAGAGPACPGLPARAGGGAHRRSRSSRRGRHRPRSSARLAQAGGRIRVADLVRDRPSLRGALDSSRRTRAACASKRNATCAAPRPWPAAETLDPRRPATRRRRSRRSRKRWSARGSTPSSCTGSRAAARPRSTSAPPSASWRRGRRVLMLVPEIALTPLLVRAAVAPVRKHGGRAAQRAKGGGAPRPVVAHPRGRGARGRGRPLGGVRAPPRAGPRGGGRGARGLLQAGGQPALPRPRRGRDAGAARGGLVVLGSATPSLESRTNADRGQVRARSACRAGFAPKGCPTSRSWTGAPCSRRAAIPS